MSSWVPALITGGLALSAAVVVAVYNSRTQRRDNKARDQRLLVQEQRLAHVNAQLTQETAEVAAKREYEYEARKRLYGQVKPLLFQLRELCEPSMQRIRRVVNGEIVVHPSNLLGSTQRLFGPLVIAQEIQRHLTAVDLSLDATVRAQYLVAKELLLNLHNGPDLAAATPTIDYDRENYPGGRRQHLTYAQLQRLVDFLTVRESDGTRRPMKQSELEDKAHDQHLLTVLDPMSRVFKQANPEATPVLWRLLLAQACFMHILVDLVDRNVAQPNALLPPDIEEFNWSGRADKDFTPEKMAANQHVECRLRELKLL